MKIVMQAGHQGGARGDGRQIGPIAGPAAEEVTVDVLRETEDQGLRTTMYAIVKKVTTPPRISRLTLDPPR